MQASMLQLDDVVELASVSVGLRISDLY